MREAFVAALGLVIVALLTIVVYQNQRRFHKPLMTTRYQAVVLASGDVFYGRIDHLGSDHPVLRDVFTIRREMDAGSAQTRYILVRRKDEAAGADHIIIPLGAISFIEPVQPDSTIGKLLRQADLN